MEQAYNAAGNLFIYFYTLLIPAHLTHPFREGAVLGDHWRSHPQVQPLDTGRQWVLFFFFFKSLV